MAGMEALGRLNNLVAINITTNVVFKMRGQSVVMFFVSGATAVLTLAQDSTFGGSFSTTLPAIKNVYWRASPGDGTVVWNKLTYINGTAPFASGPINTYTHGTTTGLTTAFTSCAQVFTSEMADPFNYIKATVSGSGNMTVVTADLVHQRGPANLEILSA